MRFPNLRAAGRELATKLESYRGRDDVIVLGILLGGAPVAHEVAAYLAAPLDMVIIRRLFAPQGPGSQVCAANVAGSMVIDEKLIPPAAGPTTPVQYFVADAIAELNRREQVCRRGRPPIDLVGKTVILVDCGIRSGSTMQAAIEAVRTKEPAQIIAAVPVASEQGSAVVAGMPDQLICLARPEPFVNAAAWYADFIRPGDDMVGELLESPSSGH